MGKSSADRQRDYQKRKWAKVLEMPKLLCQCGCGTEIPPFTKGLVPARYARGHQPKNKASQFKKGQPPWNAGLKCPQISEAQKGRYISPESMKKRTANRLVKYGGVYQTKRGWKRTPESIEKQKETRRLNPQVGERNPFYGKRHTAESRAKMGHGTGENHPGWHGGTSTLPYGQGFTRKYKRMIRERDNYTCQRCGVTQSEYGHTLEIHHIDHDKMNNDPTNLVVACHKCNVWASYHRDEPFTI